MKIAAENQSESAAFSASVGRLDFRASALARINPLLLFRMTRAAGDAVRTLRSPGVSGAGPSILHRHFLRVVDDEDLDLCLLRLYLQAERALKGGKE